MAQVVRGDPDHNVNAVLKALNEYEGVYPGSEGSVYRQNPGVVRVRIIDDRFAGMSRSRRHDQAWEFLSQRLTDDVMSEIAELLLIPTGELRSSLANLEFEDPLPSRL